MQIKRLGLIPIAAVFLLSANQSLTELKYAFLADTAAATVVATSDDTAGVGNFGSAPLRTVEYTFTEGSGYQRTERDHVPVAWPKPAVGQNIIVQYYEGQPGSSRMLGHTKVAGAHIFIVVSCAGFCAFYSFLLWTVPPKPKPAKKRDEIKWAIDFDEDDFVEPIAAEVQSPQESVASQSSTPG